MNINDVIISKLTQYVYDQVLENTSKPRNLIDRLRFKIFDKVFKIFLRYDPLVKSDIAGYSLTIPFSHRLPFILKKHRYYSSNLARISKYVKTKYSDLTMIDVGANIGDSVAIIRREEFFPILCIEGDHQFFSILEMNVSYFADVYTAKQYLGEKAKQIYIINNKLGGTGNLREDSTSTQIIEIEKLSDFIKQYPLFKNAKMLKIDTDGFDCKILRGSLEFIVQAKPIIFFEYDPFFLFQQKDEGLSIFSTLSSLEYKKLLIYDNFGRLLLSTDIENLDLLKDINLYFSGHMSNFYCDICVFHSEDVDLFKISQLSEYNFFTNELNKGK